MMDRQGLIELIKSKARIAGHDAWEGGYYHLANADEIADAILAPKPPPVPTVTCRSCKGTGDLEYTVTYHGERNEKVIDTCKYCNGLGLVSDAPPSPS